MYPFQDETLNAKERAADLLSRLTIEEKIGMLSTHNLPVERLGIGEWYVGTEIARGLVNRDPDKPSTVFPEPIGMAASFDREMMLEIGKTAAREARAYYNEQKTGGLMIWGPTVDVSRDPRWGRTEECYGEEPFLTGEMAGMYTKGLRGDDKVWATIPTLKHFCANNHEQERAYDNANLDPRLKHEHYYAAFKAPVVRGGAYSVMTAYNEVCHAPAVMNHDLKHILKKEWGLGFVVTDAADFSQNVTTHRLFTSHAQALQACLRAGSDVMLDDEACVHAAARKALAEGLITEEDIDIAVGNLLESRVLLGHFDKETPFDALTRADVNTPADRTLNLRAAREQMVLLKNNGALPLTPKTHKSIALIGPNADCNLMDWYTGYSSYQVSVKQALEERGCRVLFDLGWNIIKLQAPNGQFVRIGEDDCLYADADETQAAQFYFCVHDTDCRWVNFRHVESGRYVRLEADMLKLGNTVVYGWFTWETFRLDGSMISDYMQGKQLCLDKNNRVTSRHKARPDASVFFRMPHVSSGKERIQKLARKADAVVCCFGSDPMQVARECFDRQTIRLTLVQEGLLHALCGAVHQKKTPLILTLVSGYPYALDSVNQPPDAILHTTHAGPELGHAVADTLFGDNNPAGRCPLTWYAHDCDLPDIKDYNIMQNKMTVRWFDGVPLYPFGHGLSYSSFVYSDLKTTLTEEGIRITAKITNTSGRDGDEVVQVYAHALSERIPRPLKQLCAFARLHIAAGETALFDETVPFRELEIYDVSRERFCLEEGDFELMVGASSGDIRLTQTVHVPGETIPPRDLTKETRAELWDLQNGTEIFTDPVSGETHIRGMSDWNTITYKRCQPGDTLTIWAAAPVEPQTVKVYLGDAKKPAAEIIVPSSDGFTDFRKLSVRLEMQDIDDLRLDIPANLCLRSLQLS